jgi:hypothetical protein
MARSDSIDGVQRRFQALCARIDPALASSTLARTAGHDGSSHVGVDADGFHLVITERGRELGRRTTRDEDELLYWLVADVAWARASAYELEHRRPGVSFRRMLFAKTVEYLERVDTDWAAAKRAEFAAVLEQYPYDDDAEG